MGRHRKALTSMFPKGQWKLLRGDNVIIKAGKDAGQTGIISKVHRDNKKPGVIVKGMNLVMLHLQLSMAVVVDDNCISIYKHRSKTQHTTVLI